MKRPIDRAIVAGTLFLLAMAACGQDDAPPPDWVAPSAVPTRTVAPADPTVAPKPKEMSNLIDATEMVSPSLEEQIFDSDTIVRASLSSASASTETERFDGVAAPRYRAVNELSFTAHEYLKGSGPSEILVLVRDEYTYSMESDALIWAQRYLSQRETDWDDRQGILFLESSEPYQSGGGQGSPARSSAAPAFEFTLSNPVVQTPWDYSIDTLSRTWLPSRDAGTPGTRSSDTVGQAFITDGTASPPPVVLLADLRAQITAFEAMMAAGTGKEGFRDCVHDKIIRERLGRFYPPFVPASYGAQLASGLAAGAEVKRETYRASDLYDRFRLTGADATLFQNVIDDADGDPTTRYDGTLVAVRPLPEGVYRLQEHKQIHSFIPCDFFPDDAYDEWTVTVTAPSGTVHEAFFDPVVIGAAVGADGTNGVLKPAAFTVVGANATITSLKWESGTFTMELNPSASLAGHTIDFIALDGSVTTTLSFDDATQGGGGALTWSVAAQPWNAGDLLMLRIGSAATTLTTPYAHAHDTDADTDYAHLDSYADAYTPDDTDAYAHLDRYADAFTYDDDDRADHRDAHTTCRRPHLLRHRHPMEPLRLVRKLLRGDHHGHQLSDTVPGLPPTGNILPLCGGRLALR